MMTVNEQKNDWRLRCVAIRARIHPKQKQVNDRALCARIIVSDAFRLADTILLFSPVRGEPDLLPLLPVAQVLGISVAFPRCVGKEMVFHTVTGVNELIPDRFGIPAPAPDAPVAHLTARTLCLLPGLAAGRDGTRLGYGGGFYDRFLATFKGITLFPIYKRLLFDTVPADALDRRADHILTEKGEIVIRV